MTRTLTMRGPGPLQSGQGSSGQNIGCHAYTENRNDDKGVPRTIDSPKAPRLRVPQVPQTNREHFHSEAFR